ncbi:serine-threonine/tyrosine-protein kinase catalytic domain-containing protein [Tanacetum coccineum]
MLSPDCSYACYLVFKLEDDHVLSKDRPIFRTYYKLGVNEYRITVTANLDLSSVITIPTLKPKKETGSSKSIQKDVGISKCYIPLDYLTKSWVEKRNDGWLEARLTRPLFKHHLEKLEEHEIRLDKIEGGSLNGIIVEGVEIRPVIIDGSREKVELVLRWQSPVRSPLHSVLGPNVCLGLLVDRSSPLWGEGQTSVSIGNFLNEMNGRHS